MILELLLYLLPLSLILYWYAGRKKVVHRKNKAALKSNIQEGLTEPASLHPVIDAENCIGCGSCASACPEKNVIGLVNGRAALVHPTHCIGHGACKAACPVDAITLVFGTEKRGVDIPEVGDNFETNMPGIFIAGELGGMGLIRNAIEQGRQALDSILKVKGVGTGTDEMLDVVIVGAGPAGFSASLGALEQKLKYRTVEQDTLGGTVAHFPRGKLVMTAPVKLPIIGQVKFTETSKEQLLEFWQSVEAKTGVKIHYQERVEKISRQDRGYLVETTQGRYQAHAVLLTIGRRGTPRQLNVPGEELGKVVYRLIDPEQYKGKKVLVVGGGDSALEAATSIADQPGTEVTISYRSGSFSRAKPKNRDKIDLAEKEGRLAVMFDSNVIEIGDSHVMVGQNDAKFDLENDAVIISAGGVLPTAFLKNIGITVETKHGTA